MTAKSPPKRPRGRPVVAPEDRLEVITVRLSKAQRKKFAALGDGEWLRRQIDRARVSATATPQREPNSKSMRKTSEEGL